MSRSPERNTDPMEESFRPSSDRLPTGSLQRQNNQGASPAQAQPFAVANSTPQRGLFDTSRINTIAGGRFIQTNDNYANLIVNFHQHGRDLSMGAQGDNPTNQESQETKKARKRPRARRPKASARSDLRANAIYERQMLTKQRGHPLWIPECSLNLPIEKQKEGIVIGDVGLISSSGGFSFLFNIILPADHPFQPSTMPEGFRPIPAPKIRDIRIFNELKPHTSLTSLSVEERNPENKFENGEHIFQSSPAEGAILALPDGAVTFDLEARGLWRIYMENHIESWYKYVNGVLGREASNGDIRLVVGCDKASWWGMAAVGRQVHAQVPHELRFRPVRGRRVQVRHVWTCTGVADTRTGPTVAELRQMGFGSDVEEGPKNQCLFIRTMNGMLGEEQWARVNEEITTLLLGSKAPGHSDTSMAAGSGSHIASTSQPSTSSTANTCSNPPLSFADATNFLGCIYARYSRDSVSYNRFLAIMQDFKHGSISCLTVIEQTAELLYESAPDILQNFNIFLPIGLEFDTFAYPRSSKKIKITVDGQSFAFNTVTRERLQESSPEPRTAEQIIPGQQYTIFVTMVKLRLHKSPSRYQSFLDVLTDNYRRNGTTEMDEVSARAAEIFKEHVDLLEAFNAVMDAPGYRLYTPLRPLHSEKLIVVPPNMDSFVLDTTTGQNMGRPDIDPCYTNSHPGDTLNHFLLQESPTSRAVITTDDDWTWPLFLAYDLSTEFPNDDEFLGCVMLSRKIRLYNGVVMLDPHLTPEPEQAKATPAYQLEILRKDAQENGSHLSKSNTGTAALQLHLMPMLDALQSFHHNVPQLNDRAIGDTWSEDIYNTSVIRSFLEVLDNWMISEDQTPMQSKGGASSETEEVFRSSVKAVKSLLQQKTTLVPESIDTADAERLLRVCTNHLALPFQPVIDCYLRYRLFGSLGSLEKCVSTLKRILDFNMSNLPQGLLGSTDELLQTESSFISTTSEEKTNMMVTGHSSFDEDIPMDTGDESKDVISSNVSAEVLVLRRKLQYLTMRRKTLESQLYAIPISSLGISDISWADSKPPIKDHKVENPSADDSMQGIQTIKVEET